MKGRDDNMIISNHTRAAIAIFTAVATTFAFTGCAENASDVTAEDSIPSEDETSAKLVDDNGNPYTLIKNQDGTETAKYDDGKEVTFKRNDDGGLDVVSGSAGLIAGLAAGYFLFHGMNYSGGSYSGNRYVPSSRPSIMSSYDRDRELKRYQEEKRDQNRGGTAASTGKSAVVNSSNSTNTTSSSTTKSATSNSTNSTSKSSVSSSPKGGFGSAGARSAAS